MLVLSESIEILYLENLFFFLTLSFCLRLLVVKRR